jgi:hypothetical protein
VADATSPTMTHRPVVKTASEEPLVMSQTSVAFRLPVSVGCAIEFEDGVDTDSGSRFSDVKPAAARRLSMPHWSATASALEDKLFGRVRIEVAQFLLKLLGRDRSAVVIHIARALQFAIHSEQRAGADRAAAVSNFRAEDVRLRRNRATRFQLSVDRSP